MSKICSIKGLQFKLKKSKKNDVYRKDDVIKLTSYLKTLEPTVYTLGVRLHFCFCMRIGELRALTWKDYNEQSRTMRIWHEIVKDADGTKKQGGPGYAPYKEQAGIRGTNCSSIK